MIHEETPETPYIFYYFERSGPTAATLLCDRRFCQRFAFEAQLT
ncbi:hypothetical protein NC99_41330 [Sunxiuqinia dokdonensis]|uniref:Uncharacterized protein n=1 Tax=Sunxiuqinia dokdonensis TaxID=1409788 RepID=A0A0L8V3P3_9BACT|nr:hypothetical protein NC99_41330 [Sunxiuqinia dokdonensis]